ncbi:MAG: carboxypeptidase regulatory-like domain-containing protein [Vicinamibacterales bacterium]
MRGGTSLTALLLLCAGAVAAATSPAAQAPGVVAPQTPRQPAPGVPPGPTRDRPATPAQEEGTASMRGVVVAADTGVPLRRAIVRANSTTGAGNAMVQTDEQGRFEVTRLPAGRYIVSVSRSGYVSMQFGQRAPNQPGMPVTLEDGQSNDKVHFVLARGGAITGRIVDEFGEPVSSAQVTAQRFSYMSGVRRMTGAGGEGGFDRTDDLGQFRLYGLAPGDYYVTATLRSAQLMMPVTRAGTEPLEGYAPTYFPGTASLADATRVIVKAGEDTANVSFALLATTVARISGRVTTSSGEPSRDAMLMVMPADDGMEMSGMGATGTPIRGDGEFVTQPLAPGTYTLMVQRRFDPGASAGEVGKIDVAVNGTDVSGVLLVTGRGGIIRGRVVTEDGTVPDFAPGSMRVMATPDGPRRMFSTPPATVNADWTFELAGLLDPVRLNAFVEGGGRGWWARRALLDGTDVMDVSIEAQPGRPVDGVEIVLSRKRTTLTGSVRDARGQPVTDVTVVAFAADPARWTFAGRYVRSTRPDANGTYSLSLVPTDDYRVIAVRGLESGQASDPEFLARAVEDATAVDIREGETRTLDLQIK